MIEYEFNLNFGKIDEVNAKIPEALLKGMTYMEGQVAPLVPVETGNLVGSGDVGLGAVTGDPPAADSDHVAHLYYPGPYALYQHEGVYFRRPAHYGRPLTHTHGESFFLIRPMVQDAETVIEIVRTSLGL